MCPTAYQGQCPVEEWPVTLGLVALALLPVAAGAVQAHGSTRPSQVSQNTPLRSQTFLITPQDWFWSSSCAATHFLLATIRKRNVKSRPHLLLIYGMSSRCFRPFLCRQFSKRMGCVGKASQGLFRRCWLRLTSFRTQILAALLASMATDWPLHPLNRSGVFVVQWDRPFILQFCFPPFPLKHSLYYWYSNSLLFQSACTLFLPSRGKSCKGGS